MVELVEAWLNTHEPDEARSHILHLCASISTQLKTLTVAGEIDDENEERIESENDCDDCEASYSSEQGAKSGAERAKAAMTTRQKLKLYIAKTEAGGGKDDDDSDDPPPESPKRNPGKGSKVCLMQTCQFFRPP